MKNNFIAKIIGASLAFAMMIGGAVGINAAKEATEVKAATYSGTFERATITDLTAGDVVLIVNSNNKAMSNNNGASSAPSAVDVSVSNNKITNPADTLIWTFGKAGDNYTFLAGTSGSNYLYCTNSNNGVRVGTNDDKVFTIDSGYLKNVATSRYVGVYNNQDWRCYTSINNNISGQTFSYFKLAQSSFGTLHHIKVNSPASKLAFEVGETFSSSGLTLIGYDGENENSANSQTYTSGYTTTFDEHIFTNEDLGQQTVVVTYSGKTVSYTINVTPAPDFVIDGDENAISGLGTNTSTQDVGSGQLNGVEYGYYAFAINDYNGAKNLEFNRAIQDAYLGNNESYGKYISKIKLTLQYENNFQKLTLFKGDSAIPGTTAVTGTGSGTSRVYDFENDSEYFSLKQTTTGSWIVITKIEIYLGSEVPVIDTVVASVNAGTYYAGTTLTASDFDVTVNWTAGKSATHPTEDFTWKVNGVSNGTLNEGDNSVVVTYEGHDSLPINVIGTPASARMIIENASATQTALSYRYSKDDHIVTDTLDREFTTVPFDTNYVSWSGKKSVSDASYSGNTAGGNDSIQFNNNNSNKGIITTASGGKVAKVTVVWNNSTSANRTLDIYGKNTAYQAVTDLYDDQKQGTLIGSIIKGTSTVAIVEGNYTFIGIRARSSAMYIDSIEIEWAGETTYDYSDISIRFGGNVTKDLWNRLDSESTITGFGVMVTESKNVENFDEFKTYIESDMFESSENSEDYNKDIVDYYIPVTSMASVIGENANNYFWNLRLDIDKANMNKTYSAIAYIKINDGYVLMNMATESVETLALDYLTNRGCNETTAGGSLQAIVDNAQ